MFAIHAHLFVYGSLMRSQINHHWLGDATYLGDDALSDMDLYDLGSYPMIVPGSGVVYGERYRIPTCLLPDLDAFEEHPHVYRRQWLRLVSGTSAWVYVGQDPRGRRVPSGRWTKP